MKKSIYILTACILLITTGCKKYLDQIPDNILTQEDIFKSKTQTDNFLANIYNAVPNELTQRFVANGNSGPWTVASDEGKYTWDFNYGNNLNQSVWANTDGNVAHFWRVYYQAIRNATFFMENIDNANPDEINSALKTLYKAEARALRAYYYFQLIRIYGPVVLIGDKLLDFEAPLEDLKLSRSTFDECVNFIVEEFDIAANDLGTQPSNQEWGRVTKGMVKAYKAEALLLAASPLFNGNTNYSSLKNTDGTHLISQSYDANKWKIAADAYKAFIDEFVPSVYDLYVETNADPFLQAYFSTRNVMSVNWNKEWIFARSNSDNNTQYDRTPKHVGFPSGAQGGGALGVTQKMVDAYFMANGLPITHPSSGYVETGFSSFRAPFDVAARNTYNQWVNREPRFYVGVTYNNSYWLNQFSNPTPIITNMEFNGNSGRSQSTSDVTPTGYIIRKNVILNGSARGSLSLRLGNIFLSYAEALNEATPSSPDILRYLNLIRKRAGVPEYGSASIPVPANQAEMQDAIRSERRVELAFENVRYFDTRRWLIADETNSGPFYGLNLTKNGSEFYQKTLLETRIFLERDYFWPIPNNEILKNEKLVQNKGW